MRDLSLVIDWRKFPYNTDKKINDTPLKSVNKRAAQAASYS